MGREMAKGKKKWVYILSLIVFAVYIFAAPRPISKETVLKPKWITSLDSNYPIGIGEDIPEKEDETLLPFILGNRFGYVGEDGNFSINNTINSYISMSAHRWAEYDAQPALIKIMSPVNEALFEIENPKGYPMFLEERVYIVGNEQNSVTAYGPSGNELWTYYFPAPLTCIDSKNGFLLAGTLDGEVVLLNSYGIPIFTPFEPGGSRLSVILGCAISGDASRLALITGIGDQRFLLMERTGDSYRIIYHEFLKDGFRRPVQISFIDHDSKVAFEREEGLGIYTIGSKNSVTLNLNGEITAIDDSGGEDYLFLISSLGPLEKRFIVIRYPGYIVNEVPYRSETAFLARRYSRLYIGGDSSMALFELEKK